MASIELVSRQAVTQNGNRVLGTDAGKCFACVCVSWTRMLAVSFIVRPEPKMAWYWWQRHPPQPATHTRAIKAIVFRFFIPHPTLEISRVAIGTRPYGVAFIASSSFCGAPAYRSHMSHSSHQSHAPNARRRIGEIGHM